MMKDLMGVKRHVIWCCHDCVLLSKISINIYGGGATIKMTKVDLNLGEKYMTTMWMSKMCNVLWMGHGWVFAWGHMEHVHAWHWKIALETLHISVGGMFWVSSCSGIKTCAELPTKSWHVSVGGRFQVSDFGWHVLKHSASRRSKLVLVVSETWLFQCWFVWRLMLPTHRNLCRVASKWTMHLQLVNETMLRLHIIPPLWWWVHRNIIIQPFSFENLTGNQVNTHFSKIHLYLHGDIWVSGCQVGGKIALFVAISLQIACKFAI